MGLRAAQREMTPTRAAAKIRDLLSHAEDLFSQGEHAAACEVTHDGLAYLHRVLPSTIWTRLCKAKGDDSVFFGHGIWRFLREDPITARAALRPCGYPGDAELIDLIYGISKDGEPRETVSVFASATAACRSVRERRRVIGGLVANAKPTGDVLKVLSVGAGHLRELQELPVGENIAPLRVTAVDQDAHTLAQALAGFPDDAATGIHASVRDVLAGRVDLGRDHDIAYAAGLFDYLPDGMATKLAAAMLQSVRVGGVIAIANFAPNLSSIGYMESFMRWQLTYRDEGGLEYIGHSLVPEGGVLRRIWRDQYFSIVFAEIERAI